MHKIKERKKERKNNNYVPHFSMWNSVSQRTGGATLYAQLLTSILVYLPCPLSLNTEMKESLGAGAGSTRGGGEGVDLSYETQRTVNIDQHISYNDSPAGYVGRPIHNHDNTDDNDDDDDDSIMMTTTATMIITYLRHISHHCQQQRHHCDTGGRV